MHSFRIMPRLPRWHITHYSSSLNYPYKDFSIKTILFLNRRIRKPSLVIHIGNVSRIFSIRLTKRMKWLNLSDSMRIIKSGRQSRTSLTVNLKHNRLNFKENMILSKLKSKETLRRNRQSLTVSTIKKCLKLKPKKSDNWQKKHTTEKWKSLRNSKSMKWHSLIKNLQMIKRFLIIKKALQAQM